MACLYIANKLVWLVGELIFPGAQLFTTAITMRQIVVGAISKWLWESVLLNTDFYLTTIFGGIGAWILLMLGFQTPFKPVAYVGKKTGPIGVIYGGMGLWMILKLLVQVAIIVRVIMSISSGTLTVINI